MDSFITVTARTVLYCMAVWWQQAIGILRRYKTLAAECVKLLQFCPAILLCFYEYYAFCESAFEIIAVAFLLLFSLFTCSLFIRCRDPRTDYKSHEWERRSCCQDEESTTSLVAGVANAECEEVVSSTRQ